MQDRQENLSKWQGVVIMLAFLVVAQFAVSAGEVLHVQTGSSIQAAIDRAQPRAKIEVAKGTWRENLKIDKTIIIRGQGSQETTIIADQPGRPTLWIAPASAPQTMSVTISNLTITGANGTCTSEARNLCADGILAQGSATVIVNDCTIMANDRNGLYITDDARAIVSGSVFTDNHTGIWLSSSANATITNTDLSRSTYGIVITEDARATITYCTISENVKDGMIIADSAHVTLTANDITGNKRTGISVDMSSCYSTTRIFNGLIIGKGNTIPGPSDDQGNAFSVCPATLSFLTTRSGGFYPEQASEGLLARLPSPPPMEGREDAPVTIIEFTDFTCPYCNKFATETLPRIEAAYIDTGKAKLYFLPFPVHGSAAYRAAEAGLCAQEQGIFWDFQRLLIAQFNVRGNTVLTTDWLATIAAAAGADRDRFLNSLTLGTYTKAAEATVTLGKELGVDGTPTFFLNGRKIPGAASYEYFAQMIEDELATQ